jgi:hypothetical protein
MAVHGPHLLQHCDHLGLFQFLLGVCHWLRRLPPLSVQLLGGLLQLMQLPAVVHSLVFIDFGLLSEFNTFYLTECLHIL